MLSRSDKQKIQLCCVFLGVRHIPPHKGAQHPEFLGPSIHTPVCHNAHTLQHTVATFCVVIELVQTKILTSRPHPQP